MVLNPLQMLFPKKFLGIDIGTSYIKVVELSKVGRRVKLENYGSFIATALYQKPFRTFERSTLLLSSVDIARAILAILEEAKIKTKEAIFSIPDFSSFFTSFQLPKMTKEELPQAIRYEARSHVPLPLGEVTLDWQVEEPKPKDINQNFNILLVAVPNEVINQYKEIAKLTQLELFSLEAEVFGLVRAIIPADLNLPVALIDIGAQSTTCSIVDKQKLKLSHSFDMSGNELTRMAAQSLNIDFQKGEELKKKYGISPTAQELGAQGLRDVLLPLIDVILKEVEETIANYLTRTGRDVQKVILAGGSGLMPGLREYLAQSLKKEVEVANPFSQIFYPPILEEKLKEMGPSYSVALGMALRGFEY